MVKYESIYDVSDAWKYDPELRGNLETQICNVADELAYTTHDSDDGLRSSMINLQMLESISLWEVLINKYSWAGPFLSDVERHRMISDLVGLQVTDMIQSTDKRLKDSRVTSALDIYKLPSKLIGYNEDMLQRNRQLKNFLLNKLYQHYRVIRMQVRAEHIVTDLFNTYRSEPHLLPDHVQQLIPTRGLERTICDYIAGMTYRYAIEEHSRLYAPDHNP